MARKFLTFIILLISSSSFAQQTPFQVSTPVSAIVIQPGETKTVRVQIEIPNNYFVYQDKTHLKVLDPKELGVKKIQFPSSQKKQDPFFKKILDVYQGTAPFDIVLEAPADIAPGQRTLEALLTFQGCSDVLCYPEENHLISFQIAVGLAPGAVSKGSSSVIATPSGVEGEAISLWEMVKSQNFSEVMEKGFWIVLAVVFLGGFLTSLTPCVLPVIPITLLIIGVRSDKHWTHNFFLSAVLVLGLALTYALLGVLAVAFGKSLGFVFHEKWFVIFLSILFFVLALSMFGLFEIHLPHFLRHKLNQVKGHGLLGAFVSGAAAGLLAGPCAGPVIGGLLIFVAGSKNYLQGFGLLFVYALGMGLLFLILGTGYGTLEGRFKNYRLAVSAKHFLGILLLGGSLFYFNSVVPLFKAESSVGWLKSEPQALEIAKKENKIVLIDFYAEWCAPCKELEYGFFRKPETLALLKKMVPLRIDATFMKPEVEQVIKKYGVVGWPTILFVGPDGKVLTDLTVIAYNPERLLENMRKSLDRIPLNR